MYRFHLTFRLRSSGSVSKIRSFTSEASANSAPTQKRKGIIGKFAIGMSVVVVPIIVLANSESAQAFLSQEQRRILHSGVAVVQAGLIMLQLQAHQQGKYLVSSLEALLRPQVSAPSPALSPVLSKTSKAQDAHSQAASTEPKDSFRDSEEFTGSKMNPDPLQDKFSERPLELATLTPPDQGTIGTTPPRNLEDCVEASPTTPPDSLAILQAHSLIANLQRLSLEARERLQEQSTRAVPATSLSAPPVVCRPMQALLALSDAAKLNQQLRQLRTQRVARLQLLLTAARQAMEERDRLERLEKAFKEADDSVKQQIYEEIMTMSRSRAPPSVGANYHARLLTVKMEVNRLLSDYLEDRSRHADNVRQELDGLVALAVSRTHEEYEGELLRAQTRLHQAYLDELQTSLLHSLDAYSVLMKEAVDREVSRRVEKEMVLVRAEYETERLNRLETIHKLRVDSLAFDSLLSTHTHYQRKSDRIHKLSSAVLGMQLHLQGKSSMTYSWALIKAIALGDDVLQSAVALWEGEDGEATVSGVTKLGELQKAFWTVEREARYVSLLPPSPSFWGNAVAKVFAFLTLKERQLVPGCDDQSRLTRIGCYVKRGDIKHAVAEMAVLSPAVRQQCGDWEKQALSRVLLEEAVSIIQARVQTLQVSIGEVFND